MLNHAIYLQHSCNFVGIIIHFHWEELTKALPIWYAKLFKSQLNVPEINEEYGTSSEASNMLNMLSKLQQVDEGVSIIPFAFKNYDFHDFPYIFMIMRTVTDLCEIQYFFKIEIGHPFIRVYYCLFFDDIPPSA